MTPPSFGCAIKMGIGVGIGLAGMMALLVLAQRFAAAPPAQAQPPRLAAQALGQLQAPRRQAACPAWR